MVHKLHWCFGLLVAFTLCSLPLHGAYFQQQVDYRIRVTLDDQAHTLTGNIEIDYTNHSPDALSEIYIHLWPNAYRDDNTALARQLLAAGETNFYYLPESDRGYIDQLDFAVDGSAASWEYDAEHRDICVVKLVTPLRTGGKITVATPFFVKIPVGTISRLGHLGESYQITQWYPKPAVYDDEGWHAMPYLHQGEFFSEYGSFDVSITVPSNYIVAATGDLKTEAEADWLNQLAQKTVNVPKELSLSNKFPPSSDSLKTLRFVQDKVHDFAWFADKRFQVLKGEVELPHSKRMVSSWIYFLPNHVKQWRKAIDYLNQGIYQYSLWNGDYPYNTVSAVDGALSAGGGMEYPTITIIGEVGSHISLETVIVHEVGHNWFYGILGTNERDNPWMDEGINSYNEYRYMKLKHPNLNLLQQESDNSLLNFFDLSSFSADEIATISYLLTDRANHDQPITDESSRFTLLNYGGLVYAKAGVSMTYLAAYMGQNAFDEAMQEYFETWKFKHPKASDLRKILETHANEDLGWFFEQLIATGDPLDYKIRKLKTKNGQTTVTLKNKGAISGPVSISAITNGQSTTTKWFQGFEGKKTFRFPTGKYDLIQLDAAKVMPEHNRKDNRIRTSGILKRVEPVRFQFLGSLENPEKTQLFYTPVVGWNSQDKWMPGIALYNHSLIERKISYTLVPLFSFQQSDLRGMGRVDYNIYPRHQSPFRKIALGLSAQRFHGTDNRGQAGFAYSKLTPQVNVHMRKNRASNSWEHSFRLRGIFTSEEESDPLEADREISSVIRDEMFAELSYHFENDRVINPFSLNSAVLGHEDFLRAQTEFNYQLKAKKGSGFHFRVFAGYFIVNETTHPRFSMRMDGVRGQSDFTYDYLQFDRSGTDPFFSQQLTPTQGGFKLQTNNGRANEWLVATNLKAQLPVAIPIGLYADVGMSEQAMGSNTLYNAGFYVPLISDVLEIYVPVLFSQPISDELEANDINFGERIRFLIHLESMNPFNLADKLF